jgi:hypothetical protein
LAAAVVMLASATARAERPPVAVLWLDANAPVAESVDKALAASKEVRPLDDVAMKKLLSEGGASAQAGQLLDRARGAFFVGKCDDTRAALDEVEELAWNQLGVEPSRSVIAQSASLRLRCADLARDDQAANRAASTLAATRLEVTPEIAQVVARHPQPSPVMQPPVRVESDPPGATVYLDFAAVGPTPIDLPQLRRADAFVDVELAGHRRVHRASPAPGTLAVALSRDDSAAAFADRVRSAAGNAPESDVAALGRAVGAARVIVGRVDTARAEVQVRILDVATAKWARPVLTASVLAAPEKVARYAALEKPAADAAIAKKPAAPPEEVPAWKRWYTWVAAGGLVAIIVGVVVANHVGSDSLTISVGH